MHQLGGSDRCSRSLKVLFIGLRWWYSLIKIKNEGRLSWMEKEKLINEIARMLEAEPDGTAKMIFHILLGYMSRKYGE